MKKKILPRIFIALLAATLISTMMVSSLFAKYITKVEDKTGDPTRPAAFDIEFSGFDVDTISASFAKDGVPAPPMGYSMETYEIPFSIKSVEGSEVAANVTIKLEFDPDFKSLIGADNRGAFNGFSCACRIYRKNGSSYSELAYTESSSTVWTIEPLTLAVEQTLDCKIEVDVSYTSAEDVPQLSLKSAQAFKIRYITDAITVKVDATSVNP